MITIEKLKQFGADTDQGLARCFKNEAMYLRLVNIAREQKEFGELESTLAQNDLEGAFHAAHALKGVLGNLSLTPLYEPVTKMTEMLRERLDTDYSGLLKQVLDKKKELDALSE